VRTAHVDREIIALAPGTAERRTSGNASAAAVRRRRGGGLGRDSADISHAGRETALAGPAVDNFWFANAAASRRCIACDEQAF
jgi:hypothetical protein